MDINILNETFPICTEICSLKNEFSCECDVIVPDSKPDIKKILELSARLKITGCEAQTGRVILSGIVFFNILYLADNEEKSVNAIDVSCPFSNLFSDKSVNEGILTFSDADISELSCNISNCRKFTVKALILGNIRAYQTREIELVTDISGACMKKNEFCSTNIGAHAQCTATVIDSFELSQNKAPIKEILKYDAKVKDTDIKVIDNKAIIKGTLCVTTLYISETGLDFMESDVPFAQVLDADGISPDMHVNFDVKLFDLNVTSATVNGEEMRAIDINAELFFRVVAKTNIAVKCITDAYLPHGALDLQMEEISVSGIENVKNEKINIREIISLPKDFSPIGTVYQLVARPICEKCEYMGEKILLSGYLEVYTLYISPDSDSPVYSYKENIDFSQSFDAPTCNLTPDAKCILSNINYIISDTHSLEIRASINVTLTCYRNTKENVVVSLKEGERKENKRASIIVSYINGSLSLWDIAKEYNIDEKDILLANAIENKDDIKKGTALIIPK